MSFSPKSSGRRLIMCYLSCTGKPEQVASRLKSGSCGQREERWSRITRDSNRYATVTVSSDGKTLGTVLVRSEATVFVLSDTGHGFADPRPVLSQANDFDDWSSLHWSNDGNLLLNNFGRLLKVGLDGKSQTQLLADPSAPGMFTPFSCGTNYIVLTWQDRGGTHSRSVWRTNADGTNPLQLTHGDDDRSPACSPDQKWVYYFDNRESKIHRVPVDGSGKSETILDLPQGFSAAAGAPQFFSRRQDFSGRPAGCAASHNDRAVRPRVIESAAHARRQSSYAWLAVHP